MTVSSVFPASRIFQFTRNSVEHRAQTSEKGVIVL